jgi:hypothetical protein
MGLINYLANKAIVKIGDEAVVFKHSLLIPSHVIKIFLSYFSFIKKFVHDPVDL